MATSNLTSVPSVEGMKVNTQNSTIVSPRSRERVSQMYAADPKYKKYIQQVEKCLNSFDNVHEWADCIAFLKQLLKTFQSYMQFKEIPRKLIVAKRLSQCLNSALPTGVHQRALDVYTHIFAVLGQDGLRRDLGLWSSGIFPFFEYAATSVKPTLLNIYDTYYLPLQGELRPVMKSFILALLPGLEEETGEFFEKVLSLLDRLSGAVSLSFFFQNIWLVMLTTPSARGTSLNYLSRRLPKFAGDEDITDIVGRDIGLMIRAFAAALEDENLLVRRGALDILLQSMRIDSFIVKKAHTDDRTILMRAATGVVLRRDLSLNRRLYTWLLGPDEKSENQVDYLKANAIDLLSATLRDEMMIPSGEYSESRPFKIFISLLDKWEIGALLTEVLVYDAIKAVKQLIQKGTDSAADLTMTANTLYEAVEPQVIWKHLLSAAYTEISGNESQFEAIHLIEFILKSFSQDEEVQTIQLPVIFTALVDLMEIQVQASPTKILSPSIREGLRLLEEILLHIPPNSLLQRPELTGEIAKLQSSQGPYTFACTFFNIRSGIETPPITILNVPLASAFQNLILFSEQCARNPTQSQPEYQSLCEVFSRSLILIEKLSGRLNSKLSTPWNPQKWLSALLFFLDQESSTFTMVDHIVHLTVALHRNEFLVPKLNIDDRSIMYTMVTKLLRYLRPEYAGYHVRAVNLLWALQGSTQRPHVESIIAHSLTNPASRDTHEAYEAFGVFWRLTDDSLQPGFKFKVPMMIVLDTLKSEDPTLRRIGETWIRCSLKSYLRVLDPILYELLDSLTLRAPTVVKVCGRELTGFVYERPFDQRYMSYLLEILLSLVRFGGQGFAKTARISSIKRSFHTGLVQRVDNSGFFDSEASYLDTLVEILVRLLQSEPKQNQAAAMHLPNTKIHSAAIDLLQVIVARGEIDDVAVESAEAAVVGKLFFSIHTRRLDLQNKLLHLLHSLISVSTSKPDTAPKNSSSTNLRQDDAPPESTTSHEKGNESRYSLNPLLVQTLVDGISVKTNRPALQHWLDFILMAIPQFQPALQAVVSPLNECLCRQTMNALQEVVSGTSHQQEFEDAAISVTDAELIMLLNGLERLVLLSLAYTSEMDSSEEESITHEKAGGETTGLLGYVSNVFSSENLQHSTGETLTARSAGYRSLDEGIRVLYSVWAALIWEGKKGKDATSMDESLSLIYSRTRQRCRRVLEHLFRVQAVEVLESVVDYWSQDLPLVPHESGAAYELVDVLLSNAQNVVHMICESISCRISSSSERSKKQALNPNLTDATLFRFLEQYLQRLEGPIALQVWARYLQLAKDVGTARDFKPYTYYALRCMHTLAEKITQTTAMEDKRIRKELQDNYGKLLDPCIIFAGRSGDSSSWIRRSAKEAISANGIDSPSPRIDAKLKLDEKADGGIPSAALETPRTAVTEAATPPIIIFIAKSCVPNLRKFLLENDKILSTCNNITYYMVNPALRGKTKPIEVDPILVTIIQEMAKIPTTLKAWKNIIVDLLNDNRLFSCSLEDANNWRPIVKTLFDADKSAFPELIGRVASSPTANIFANREYEMLLRSLNVRRLSYVLFSGDKNQFLTQLPIIQEKLVDILRNVPSQVVQSEVFLCIRVLLCRLSGHNLTNFWPVVLTELYRIFEQTMVSVPADGSEELPLILAASKCLDLLLVLQTEGFQIHQWIFITDTVDAVYRPDDWLPEAMMDQLAEVAGSITAPTQTSSHTFADSKSIRRPLLNSVRQIESIRDLIPFFNHVSISSYESVYSSGGNVDWNAVEKGILDDMFDG